MEQIDLTTPVSAYQVVELHLRWPDAIKIVLLSPSGDRIVHQYTGSDAQTLLIQLNKLDLSAISLHRRILNRLVADGKIAGTVSGAPD